MVDAVYKGYIARLSLVSLLYKPLLRPGWCQVILNKCTPAVVQQNNWPKKSVCHKSLKNAVAQSISLDQKMSEMEVPYFSIVRVPFIFIFL